jgi:hypothetical protein
MRTTVASSRIAAARPTPNSWRPTNEPIGLGARHLTDRLPHRLGLLGGIVVLQRGRDLDVGERRRGLLHEARLGPLDLARSAPRSALDGALEAVVLDGRALRLGHEREVPVTALIEVGAQQVTALLGLGAGHAEAVRQQVTEAGRRSAADQHDDDPACDHPLAMGDDPVGPANQCASGFGTAPGLGTLTIRPARLCDVRHREVGAAGFEPAISAPQKPRDNQASLRPEVERV